MRKANGMRTDLPTGVVRPQSEGLYDAMREHDACGVGFIVDLKNRPSQKIVQNGLSILENLEHRGAVGADPLMGDGAGIMVQIPHRFFVKESARLGYRLPEAGAYAVGFIFMPQDADLRMKMEKVVDKVIEDEGQTVIGWRDVPSDNSSLSKAPDIVATEPCHRQVIIGRGEGIADEEAFERKLYVIRKVMSSKIYSAFEGKPNDFYIVSMSCRTLVYKGMFLAAQLAAYYPDLHDPDFELLSRWCTRALRRPWRWSTSASRPTPSRRGSSLTPTGWSPTTARSTRYVATTTGWRRVRRPCPRRCSATRSASCGRSRMRASPTRRVSTTRSNS